MTTSDQQPSGPERLVQAYNRMMERVQKAIDKTEKSFIPPLQRNIEMARNRAVELGELTREEAAKIGSYLQRDLEDAGHYLAKSGREFRDWLRIDLEAIEDRALDMLTQVADKTKLEWLELEKDLREGPPYQSGEITGPGTLICEGCGEPLHFHTTEPIPPCRHCHGTVFRRVMPDMPGDD
ncbi:MAG: zinc ribbon-containing protein [Gammaproteobacteria bacterium]